MRAIERCRTAAIAVVVCLLVTTSGCRREEAANDRLAGESDVGEFGDSDLAVVVVRASNFDREVLETARPALVEFGSPNCAACVRMAPDLERLAADFEDTAVVARVDCERDRELAERFAIRAFPVFLVFHAGEFVARLDGEQDPNRLRHGLVELTAGRPWPRPTAQEAPSP